MGVTTAIIVGAAAAVAASTVTAVSTAHAARKNAESVADTNAQNYKIWQEQKAYQTSEREAAQEYNDPSAQKARFSAAGFNPYVMMNQIDAGNTVAQTSPPAPTMQAYQQPTIPWGDLLSSAVAGGSQASQMEGIKLDNDAKVIDLTYKNNEKILELMQKRENVANTIKDTQVKQRTLDQIDESIKILQDQNDQLRATSDERKAQTKAQSKISEQQGRLTQLEADAQEFSNSLQPQQRQQLVASIKEIYSRMNVNSASAASAFADAALKNASENGVKIDNYQKNKLNWILREAAKADLELKKYTSRYPNYFGREIGQPFFEFLNYFGSKSGMWNPRGNYLGK